MQTPYFKIKKLKEEAIVPSKREEDAAYDLYAVLDEDFKLLKPGDLFLAPTGLACQIPKDWVLYVAERGSTGTKGLARRAGVVDSGYRGEIFVPLNNTSNKPIVLAKSEGEELDSFLEKEGYDRLGVVVYPLKKAVAQGMLLYTPHAEVEVVEELDEHSERGAGAMGSSGK